MFLSYVYTCFITYLLDFPHLTVITVRSVWVYFVGKKERKLQSLENCWYCNHVSIRREETEMAWTLGI